MTLKREFNARGMQAVVSCLLLNLSEYGYPERSANLKQNGSASL